MALSTLMPEVGETPDANWDTAKLYAPHVAKVLAEVQTAGAESTAAAARLLGCSAAYAAYVECDYKQALE